MRRALLGFLILASLAPAALALDVPYLSGRVNDDARLFDPVDANELDGALRTYEAKTGRQFVVLTITTLGDEVLEDYSIKVARAWKLGRKGQDDGILMLIAKDDHKVRIEVGYGLEGDLPDAKTGRIIHDEMIPRFRAGSYGAGARAGVAAVIKTLDGTYSPPPDPLARRRGGIAPGDMGVIDKVMMSFFVFGILGLFEFVGLCAPGVGWFLYFFLIPFWAVFPMSIWGSTVGMGILAAHLLLFPIVKKLLGATDWGKSIAKNFNQSNGHGYSSGTGWSSGGGGWSSGGGGFSSGGFSGGGGSFGGGGASGSW